MIFTGEGAVDADDIHTRSFMLKMIGDIGVCPLTQKDVL